MEFKRYSRPKLPRNKYGEVGDGSKTIISSGGSTTIDNLGSSYSDFVGATPTNDGESGLVPAPKYSEVNYFLKGDGTWAKIPNAKNLFDTPDGLKLTGNLEVTGTIKGDTSIETPLVKADNGEIDNLSGKTLGFDEGKFLKLVSGEAEIKDTLTTKNINNSETITTKNLTVTGSAHFFELIIDKIKSSGGSVLFTPADGFDVDKVEFFTTQITIGTGDKTTGGQTITKRYYKLFWRCDDESKSRKNMWMAGDQAICYSFNQASTGTTQNVSNKYYWSLVTEVSSNPVEVDLYGDGKTYKCNYIVLSANIPEFDGTLNPEPGDSIAMLGSRTTDTKRQSAIYISSYSSLDPGIEAPFIAQYQGITDFSLGDHRKSYFGASGSEFIGNFKVSTGDSLEDYINNILSEGQFEVSAPTFIFKSSSEKPDKPTSTTNIPSGWSTSIPSFTNITSLTFDYSGNGVLQDDGYRKLPGNSINNNFVKDVITFTTTAAYTKLTFDLRSSSETNYDFLYVGSPDIVYSNRSEIYNGSYGKLSGETSKTLDVIVSGVGSHFIEVIYSKDASVNANDDAGYYKISGVKTRGKIWYSYAVKSSGASGTTYGEWTEPEEWNEPGANGNNGTSGDDAEFYTTFLTNAYAVYNASKQLKYNAQVNLYHIKGEEFESITPTLEEYNLSYAFRNSDGNQLGPYSSTGIVEGGWLISGTDLRDTKYDALEITVRKGGVIISSHSIPISVKPGAFFSVTDTIEGRVTDAEGNISTLRAQANSIQASIRTINGQLSTLEMKDGEIEGRVSNAEGNISSLNLSVQGLTSEVGKIKVPKNLKNLLPGTDFRKNEYPGPNFNYGYPRLKYGYDGYPGALFISKSDTEYSGLQWCSSSPGGNIKVTKGKKYTLSCWYKIDPTYYEGSVLFEYIGHNSSGETERQLYKSYYPNQNERGKWLLGSITFTAEYDYYEIYILCHRNNEGEIRCEFSCPMLEEGETYGGYTLSPLDYDVVKKNKLTNSGLLGYDGHKENINRVSSRATYEDFQKTDFKAIKFKGTSSDYDALEFLVGTEVNQDYVLSFYAKSDTEDIMRTYFYDEVGNGVTLYSENSDDFIYYSSDGYSLFKLSKDWKRYWVHYRTRGDISYNPCKILFRFLGKEDSDYTEGYIACPKLEIGTQPTLFTTDTVNDSLKDETLNASSLIKQTQDEIRLEVYGELGKAGIDIQSGEITLDASKTTIKGNLAIRKSTDGIEVYDENNNSVVQINNTSIVNSSEITDTIDFGFMATSDYVDSGGTRTFSTNEIVPNTQGKAGKLLTFVNTTIYLDKMIAPTGSTLSLKLELYEGSTLKRTSNLTGVRQSSGMFTVSIPEYTISTSSQVSLKGTYTVTGLGSVGSTSIYTYSNCKISSDRFTHIGKGGILSLNGANNYFLTNSEGTIIRGNQGYSALKVDNEGIKRPIGLNTSGGMDYIWGSIGGASTVQTNHYGTTGTAYYYNTSHVRTVLKSGANIVDLEESNFTTEIFLFDQFTPDNTYIKLPIGSYYLDGKYYSVSSGRKIEFWNKRRNGKNVVIYVDDSNSYILPLSSSDLTPYYTIAPGKRVTALYDGFDWIIDIN